MGHVNNVVPVVKAGFHFICFMPHLFFRFILWVRRRLCMLCEHISKTYLFDRRGVQHILALKILDCGGEIKVASSWWIFHGYSMSTTKHPFSPCYFHFLSLYARQTKCLWIRDPLSWIKNGHQVPTWIFYAWLYHYMWLYILKKNMRHATSFLNMVT